MKQFISVAIVALAVGCGSARPQAQLELQRLSLYGRAVDSVTGAPIALAGVELDSTHWGSFTDSTGHFTLRGIPAGSYVVRLRSPCEHKRVLGTTVVALNDTGAVRTDFTVALDSLSRCHIVWLRSVR